MRFGRSDPRCVTQSSGGQILMKLTNQTLGSSLSGGRGAVGLTGFDSYRRTVVSVLRLGRTERRLIESSLTTVMVVEFSRGTPGDGSQQQKCEQACSFCRASENHLCWFTDHGSQVWC
jgi:hypothetical protein